MTKLNKHNAYRAGFSLNRELFKKCVSPSAGGRPNFSWKKTGDLFSDHRLSAVSSASSPLFIFLFIFSGKTGDLFLVITVAFIHFTRSLGCRPLFTAWCYVAKKLPLLLWGIFVGAPVRRNMLNMSKSAAACIYSATAIFSYDYDPHQNTDLETFKGFFDVTR